MLTRKIAEKVFPALDRSLRAVYPGSFPFRCLQASVALDVYLSDAGYKSWVVAGDYGVETPNINTRELETHGFGHETSEYSHFWVETPEYLIDIMPRYIPDGNGGPVLRPPMLMWRKTAPLPAAFNYITRNDEPPLRRLMGEDDVDGIGDLLDDFRRRLAGRGVGGASKAVLFSPSCIPALARRKDPWCSWALRTYPSLAMSLQDKAGRGGVAGIARPGLVSFPPSRSAAPSTESQRNPGLIRP